MLNRVYTAGPYTGDGSWEDKTENTERAIEEFHRMLDLDLNPFCPHLFHYAEQQEERHYKEWLDLDMRWLEQCDSLVRLDGESPGSDQEVEYCRENDIPYFLGTEEFNEYIDQIGQIYVIMGPSGVGKTTVVNRLLESSDKFEDRYEKVTSCTSRDERDDEKEGDEYYFMSEEEMQEIKENDGFVEYVEYRGNQYGFRKIDFNEPLNKGKSAVVVADKEGYRNLKEYYDDRPVHGIVMLPTSIHTTNKIGDREFHRRCKERLKKRMEGDRHPLKIQQRLENVGEEIDELLILYREDPKVSTLTNGFSPDMTVEALQEMIQVREHDHHSMTYRKIRAQSDG